VASETVTAGQHAVAEHAADHPHGPAYLHHHFDDVEQQRECTSLGMWSFLATEIMMFGGLFFVYSLYRWLYPDAFHIGSHHLNITLGTGNTFVLLFSSLTMAMAVHFATENNPRMTVICLGLTWILGAAFIGIKAVEWTTDYREGLVPGLNWTYYNHEEGLRELANKPIGPQHVMMYFVIYFSMTGLHAIHMIIGLILVGVFMRYAAKGQFNGGNDQPVELMGLYWHFVDIVWVFLFPLLYLIAGFHPGGLGGGAP